MAFNPSNNKPAQPIQAAAKPEIKSDWSKFMDPQPPQATLQPVQKEPAGISADEKIERLKKVIIDHRNKIQAQSQIINDLESRIEYLEAVASNLMNFAQEMISKGGK